MLKCSTGMYMGDRADMDNIYHTFPPQTLYILVLILVQDHLKDMNNKYELFDTQGAKER